MKKLFMLCVTLLFVSVAQAQDEKEGFLTTQYCAERGMFSNCKLETLFCGYEGCYKDEKEFKTDIDATLVLFVHNEGKYYTVDFAQAIDMGKFLKLAMNKNEVTLVGDIDETSIKVYDYKAPPPPKKSFFKKCL